MSWRAQAACKGRETVLWFEPPRVLHHAQGTGKFDWSLPRSICDACPVKAECLDYGRSRDPQPGMFGGMTSEERAETLQRIGRIKACLQCGAAFSATPWEQMCSESCRRTRLTSQQRRYRRVI